MTSVEYWERRRRRLLGRILTDNGEKLQKATIVFCENCYRRWTQVELHIHHVNGKDWDASGGWQRFYKHLEDFENGVDLKVLCKDCHMDAHSEPLFEVDVDG